MDDTGDRPTERLDTLPTSATDASSSVPLPATGEHFGKYEVLTKVGQGGFGVVFKGRDPVLQRTVAIKTCSTLDEKLRQRFFREGQIAAGLQHANVTTVHDLGVQGGVPYLVQEFLAGEDLDHLIETGAELKTSTRLDILLQIARGLEYAHQAGVLHRDVKPSNIRVLADGTVKIMDFGIAKLLNTDTRLTGTGVAMGTAGYLAPEQLRSEELDERADVFSFGVLAYELLTGQRPFQGEDFSQISYQLLYVEPSPVNELWPECPTMLGTIVGRCLAKDRVARYPDFTRVIADLEPLYDLLRTGSRATGSSTTGSQAMQDETWQLPSSQALSSPPRKMPAGRWAFGALGVLAAVVAGAWWFQRPDDSSSMPEPLTVAESATESPLASEASAPPPNTESDPAPDSVAASQPPGPEESSSASAGTAPPTVIEEPQPASAVVAEPVSLPVDISTPEPEPDPTILAELPSAEEPVSLGIEESPPPPQLSSDPATASPAPPATASSAPPPASPPQTSMKLGDLIHPGPGVELPRLIERPEPVYPPRARRRRQEGRVIVRVLVNEKGRVQQTIIAETDAFGFAVSAKQAALRARYEPATRDGIAGKMWTELPFEFRLQ